MEILCPYCDALNDDSDKKCMKCNNRLEGVDYFKKLVSNYKHYKDLLEDEGHQNLLMEAAKKICSNPEIAYDAITNLLKQMKAISFIELKMAISRHDILTPQPNILKIYDNKLRNELKKISKLELNDHDINLKRASFYLSSDDVEAYSREFFDIIHPIDFFDREVEFGALILGVSTPEYLGSYLDELKSTFSFGLFTAAVMVCRALIELSLKYALVKEDKLSFEEINEKRIKLSEITNICLRERIIDKNIKDKIDKICERTNLPIHKAEEYKTYSKNEAILVIRDSFIVIEHLYSGDKKEKVNR